MAEKTDDKKEFRERIKALREKRKESISQNKEVIKQQRKDISSLKKELKKGPATIPDLSQNTGIASDKVMWYISALKKYGEVESGELDKGYLLYSLSD